jgi:ATP-dependent Clp protease protease subunit
MEANSQILARKADHFRMVATPEGVKTIEIFNEISDWWGYGLTMLANELQGHEGSVLVKINSLGGELIQGVAIRNYIQQYNAIVEIIGVAASSATIIATGGRWVKMHQGALYMIHNPLSPAGGKAADLEQYAADLRKLETEMRAIYAASIRARGKMKEYNDAELDAKLAEWMDAETWFTAEEAVKYGFADEVVKSAEARANIEAQTKTRYYAQASFKNMPAFQESNKKQEAKMSKNTLSGFLDGLKNLINQTEAAAEETPVPAAEMQPDEVTAATEEEIAAAVKMLTDLGYKVELPEAETVEVELPVEAATKEEEKPMMSAEAVEALVSAKVEAALKAAKAAKPVTQAAAKPAATTAEQKREEIKNKVAKAFDSLASQMKNN